MSLGRRIFQERRAVVLPLAIALVANIAILVLAVLPLTRSVANMDEQAVNSSLALSQARHLEKSAKGALDSRARATTELEKFYAEILPRDDQASIRIFFWLRQAAEGAGLRVTGGGSDLNDINDSRLTRASTKISLEGTYANIRRFLYTVETAEEFVVIERVELQQTGTDAPANTSGKLLVTLSVATYFLTQ